MAKKKKDEERVIPKVCYCRNCDNGGRIEDFKIMCTIKNIWQHSPQNCKNYNEKES